MSRVPRSLVVAAVLGGACLLFVSPSAAAARSAAHPTAREAAAVTYVGAFEFEGLAGHGTTKNCAGEGVFGEAKPGAQVISERNAAGTFSVLGTGTLAKGKVVKARSGDKVCRMSFRVKAPVPPADTSTVYLEVKGLTFNVRFPATGVADGDLGTWTCGYSDKSCALVVGN